MPVDDKRPELKKLEQHYLYRPDIFDGDFPANLRKARRVPVPGIHNHSQYQSALLAEKYYGKWMPSGRKSDDAALLKAITDIVDKFNAEPENVKHYSVHFVTPATEKAIKESEEKAGKVAPAPTEMKKP